MFWISLYGNFILNNSNVKRLIPSSKITFHNSNVVLKERTRSIGCEVWIDADLAQSCSLLGRFSRPKVLDWSCHVPTYDSHILRDVSFRYSATNILLETCQSLYKNCLENRFPFDGTWSDNTGNEYTDVMCQQIFNHISKKTIEVK